MVEDDDALHRPEKNMAQLDRGGALLSVRGLANLGCIAFLGLGLVALLCVPPRRVPVRAAPCSRALAHSGGYPLISHLTKKPLDNHGGFNVGGANATGQVRPHSRPRRAAPRLTRVRPGPRDPRRPRAHRPAHGPGALHKVLLDRPRRL
jgi:hypothetical protein